MKEAQDQDNLSPEQALILHVIYEDQHKAGKRWLGQGEIAARYKLAIAEFGSPKAAVIGIRKRLGLS